MQNSRERNDRYSQGKLWHSIKDSTNRIPAKVLSLAPFAVCSHPDAVELFSSGFYEFFPFLWTGAGDFKGVAPLGEGVA